MLHTFLAHRDWMREAYPRTTRRGRTYNALAEIEYSFGIQHRISQWLDYLATMMAPDV